MSVTVSALRLWSVAAIAVTALLGATFAVAAPSAPSTPFNTLVFSDEFDELDVRKWQHEITAGGGGNWEFQVRSTDRSIDRSISTAFLLLRCGFDSLVVVWCGV